MLLCSFVFRFGFFSFKAGTMKHQQKNHYFTNINTPDIYCLRGAWVGAPFEGSGFNSDYESPPPPPPTSPLNIIIHYSKTTLKALVLLPLLFTHFHL